MGGPVSVTVPQPRSLPPSLTSVLPDNVNEVDMMGAEKRLEEDARDSRTFLRSGRRPMPKRPCLEVTCSQEKLWASAEQRRGKQRPPPTARSPPTHIYAAGTFYGKCLGPASAGDVRQHLVGRTAAVRASSGPREVRTRPGPPLNTQAFPTGCLQSRLEGSSRSSHRRGRRGRELCPAAPSESKQSATVSTCVCGCAARGR